MLKTAFFTFVFALLAVLSAGGGIDVHEPDPRAKVALVIGQQRYDAWPYARTAERDALDMAELLTSLGFDTTLEVNLTRRGMERALGRFEDRIGPRGVGLIYYSGHGMQRTDGIDYLIPIDAVVPDGDADLRATAINVAEIENRVSRYGDRLIIMLLDMSRNTVDNRTRPIRWDLRSRAVDGNQGGALDLVWGSAILFAAAPGQVAIEMGGDHSVFTEEMLKALEEPRVSLHEVFTNVSIAVDARTSGRQNPWRMIFLRGARDFYFSGDDG